MPSSIQSTNNVVIDKKNQVANNFSQPNKVADYPDDKFEKTSATEEKNQSETTHKLLLGATAISTAVAAYMTHKVVWFKKIIAATNESLGNILKSVGKDVPTSVDETLAQVQKTITVDKLTGLFNRGFLDANLPKDYQEAIKSGKSFSVGMMDMDKFKSVNDTLGHSTGDTFLEQIAKCMSGVTEKHGAKAYRYGGEEFIITAVGLDKEKSKIMMDEIANAIKGNDVIQGHKDKFLKIANDKLNFAKEQLDLIGPDSGYNIFRKLSDAQENKLSKENLSALANDISIVINEYISHKKPNNKKELLALVEKIRPGSNDLSTLLSLKTSIGESNLGIELNNILKKHIEDKTTFTSGLQHFNDHGKFTISGGVVNVADGNVVKNAAHLPKIADAASYAAKTQGRNRNIEANNEMIETVLAELNEKSK